jgi:hypothetical protein
VNNRLVQWLMTPICLNIAQPASKRQNNRFLDAHPANSCTIVLEHAKYPTGNNITQSNAHPTLKLGKEFQPPYDALLEC